MPIQKITSGIIESNINITGNLSLDSTGTTGFRAPSANTLVFHTAGTEDMRIDSAGNVGIGTTSPTDTAGFSRALDVNGSGGAALYTRTNGSATSWTVFGNYGVDGYINNRGAGSIQFYNNNAERMRIDSAGRLTKPYQPAFMAKTFLTNGSSYSGLLAVLFATVVTNRGNHFNTGSGVFTCPVAGDYYVYFNHNLRVTSANWHSAYILKNGSQVIQSWADPSSDHTYANAVVSCVLNCAAGDTIIFAFSGSYSAPSTSPDYNHASIYLLG